MLFIIMFIIIFSYTSAYGESLDKIDLAGNKILKIFRRIGYWVILVKAIQDIIKCAMSGDTRSLGSIVVKYILIYGALFFLPWILRLVEGIF